MQWACSTETFGDNQQALEHFTHALETASPALALDTYYYRASVCSSEGETPTAVADLDKIIAAGGNSDDYVVGRRLTSMGRQRRGRT